MGTGAIRVLIVFWVSCLVCSTAAAQASVDDYYRDYPKQKLMDIQQMLIWTGDYTGAIDGMFGPATESAIQKYQIQNGWAADGLLTDDQQGTLFVDGTEEMKRSG